jgi:hypothetical protein
MARKLTAGRSTVIGREGFPMKSLWALLAISALYGTASLAAHHSFAAEFDASKAIRVTGALTKVEWTNPHIYFYLDAKDESGGTVKWGCSAGSPGALSRRGFKRGDLKLGDTIIVDGYRAKDGSNFMDARRVTLPDGRIVSGASAGDGGPDEPAQPR